MKVSIVIPCYNEKATIEKIVEAVRAAPIQSKEIIIVDDGSRDGTKKVLNEISNTIDQVIIILPIAARGQHCGAVLRQRPVILFSFKTRTWSTAPKIIPRSLSHYSRAKQTRFSARVLWGADRTGFFFSGTWLAIVF